MARGKSRGKSARKARRSAISNQQEAFEKVPHSFVFHRGTIGRTLRRLVHDVRKIFEPFTAANLSARKSNSLRDFVSIAGPLNVHFFIMFSKTDSGVYMKIARVPHGPTLTFRVVRYSLAADVLSSLRKYNVQPSLYCQPPLLILNGFGGAEGEASSIERDAAKDDQSATIEEMAKRPSAMHFTLATTILQNVFAPLNVNHVKLDNVTRVAMFNFDPETNLFDFRHYRVKAVPIGLSRPIRKLLKKNVPDLSRFADVADYVERGASYQTTSESEAELLRDEDAHVVLPTKMAGRGNEASHKSAIRLFDIGPRMTLQLVKIEDGLCNGAVLFHAFVEKTGAQLADLVQRRREKQRVKQERRRQQDENVRRKQKLTGRKRVRFDGNADDNEGDDNYKYDNGGEDNEDDDRADDYEADRDESDEDGNNSRNFSRRPRKYGRSAMSTARSGKQMQRSVKVANRRTPKFKMQVGSPNFP